MATADIVLEILDWGFYNKKNPKWDIYMIRFRKEKKKISLWNQIHDIYIY